MRILHTSDWHLGRSFHGFSLHELTSHFLEELLQTVRTENIDVVLISGDVYDQAQPRTETIGLLSHVLEELSTLGCTVVLTNGNHDSALRLGFAAKLLARQNIHIRTSLEQISEPLILEEEGTRVEIFALPYLEPRSSARRFGVQPSHRQVLGFALDQIRQTISSSEHTATRIVMAHCFVSGSQPADSERNIAVGGIETVGYDIFDGIDYVALGHLHGRQKLTDSIRYSGSPLAFSFSEEKHHKGCWILDIGPQGITSINSHPWQTLLPLKTLRGKMADLCTHPDYAEAERAICRIYLTDDVRPLGALEKLRERFPRVAELYFEPENRTPALRTDYAARVQEKENLKEITEDFFAHVRGSQLTPQEAQYLETVCQDVEAHEVEA